MKKKIGFIFFGLCCLFLVNSGVLLSEESWWDKLKLFFIGKRVEKTIEKEFKQKSMLSEKLKAKFAGDFTESEIQWFAARGISDDMIRVMMNEWGVPKYELKAIASETRPVPEGPDRLYGNWLKRRVATGSAITSEIAGRYADDPKFRAGIVEMYASGLAWYLYDGNFGVPDGILMSRFKNPTKEKFLPPKLEDYSTINEFFTRELREPLIVSTNPGVMASPADCMLFTYEGVRATGKALHFKVKGEDFVLDKFLSSMHDDSDVVEFLKEKQLRLEDYNGGSLLIFRLRPIDYHHFHAPFDCKVLEHYELEGKYHSVDPYASKYDPMISNTRTIIVLDTSFGKAVMVAVGALMVGEVVLDDGIGPGRELKKGDRVGHFEFGGSTVVVLLPGDSGFVIDDVLKDSTMDEIYVKAGQNIGRLPL